MKDKLVVHEGMTELLQMKRAMLTTVVRPCVIIVCAVLFAYILLVLTGHVRTFPALSAWGLE